jgi:hypothetical protein
MVLWDTNQKRYVEHARLVGATHVNIIRPLLDVRHRTSDVPTTRGNKELGIICRREKSQRWRIGSSLIVPPFDLVADLAHVGRATVIAARTPQQQ